MSALRLKYFLRDNAVRRLWNTWTRNYLINSVVRNFKRDRVIQCFKQVILRPRHTLLLTATAVCKSRDDSFPCEQGISDSELQALLEELEGLQKLAKLTIYCTSCGKRLVIDRKQTGVSYCVCKDSKPSQNSSEGWVPYMEAADVIIWRKEYKSGQYAYKVYGRYAEVSASDFAAVQIDGAYRKAWDNAVAALSVVQRGALGIADQAVMHWEVLWPRLFANRDYVYIRRHKEVDLQSNTPKKEESYDFTSVHAKARRKSRESYEEDGDKVDNKVYIILSKACDHPDVPETKHAIRVTEYWSHMVVKTLNGVDKPGMEFVLTYYDEPAVGGMPGGVAAWASSRAAPDYLLKMRRAASNYRSWAQRRGKEDLPDFTPFGPDQVSFEENAEQISEQEMESSKLGPDLDNDVERKDKETQTDVSNVKIEEKEIKSEEIKEENNEIEAKKEKKSINDEETKVDDEQKELSEEEVAKDDEVSNEKEVKDNDDKECNKEEGDGNSNGSWWRYLYPFYYFV